MSAIWTNLDKGELAFGGDDLKFILLWLPSDSKLMSHLTSPPISASFSPIHLD